MHVDVRAVPLREPHADSYVLARRLIIRLPVRHAADDITAGVHRGVHQLGSARISDDSLLRENHDLDVAQIGVIDGRLDHSA
jgi:hypothetical protein